ncbi:MAG: diguanylate cyclase [Rhizobiales bacterium]|nr:diguanylate cyclase [Hyphomicrobiales bacterium]
MSRFPARSDEHRRQLAGERAQGPHAQSDMAAFDSILRSEYPALASAPGLDRRSLLRIMGASLALAGLSGCTPEAEEAALPYVNQPEFVLPGQPRWYATAVTFCGPAQPVLAKTHVGRPVKLEGNRDHPLTGGGTDPFLQAALLGLYDPDRSQGPRRDGRPTNWASSEAALTELVQQLDAVQGEGFRLLTGATTSATFARQLAAVLRPQDLFGRMGGEEFAILLPEISPEDARGVAERVRAACDQLELTLDDGRTIKVTTSIGLAGGKAMQVSLQGLLKQADDALYAAKREGRNRVIEAAPVAA